MTRAAAPGETEVAAAAVAGEAFAPADEKYVFAGGIGEGGMGEVLLVEDKDLKRQVAMKLLRPELAETPAHRLRFVAEAQATSQLEHPGIPPVHDIGINPAGQIYFTMKLVRGRTLAEILKDLLLGAKTVRREYTPHKLISILERVCEAMHFAHEQGVIHRDLKPENIMLGEYGEVHVMDWGIAKLAAGEDEAVDDGWDDFGDDDAGVATTGSDVLMTQMGAIKGTIPYMSPEQASGEPLDRRSDVYALGCLLYEILTLYPAFEGGGMELLPRVQAGDFVPVTERNPKRTIPASLSELCTQSMARDPAQRPASADAFGDELRAWLDGRAERSRKHKEAEALAAKGIASLARYELLGADADAAEKTRRSIPGSQRRRRSPVYAETLRWSSRMRPRCSTRLLSPRRRTRLRPGHWRTFGPSVSPRRNYGERPTTRHMRWRCSRATTTAATPASSQVTEPSGSRPTLPAPGSRCTASRIAAACCTRARVACSGPRRWPRWRCQWAPTCASCGRRATATCATRCTSLVALRGRASCGCGARRRLGRISSTYRVGSSPTARARTPRRRNCRTS
jgi:serine/threonine protein kinase